MTDDLLKLRKVIAPFELPLLGDLCNNSTDAPKQGVTHRTPMMLLHIFDHSAFGHL